MDNDRGRTSRASSTSSLGREVRCACQFFQSDSLLPERRAAMSLSRPSSRAAEHKPTFVQSKCEHEYEPVGKALIIPTGPAPVVKIIDTDIVPVADSNDSIDIRGRFTPGPALADIDIIIPLDGRIEDNAMEGKELGSGDTSEEIETAQQLQDRLEEHFLTAATTPCTEPTTDVEVNTSQVDSSVAEEVPLRRGARGLPERIKTQAGKFRSRIQNIQRPNFPFATDRNKNKTKKMKTAEQSKSSGKISDTSPAKDESVKMPIRQGRIERIKDYTLSHKPKFNFLHNTKFRLPERPKINLTKLKSTGSFRLPTLPKRQRPPNLGEQKRQYSNESTVGSRKNIFDFSTVPRLFEKKFKGHSDHSTSSPKESRTHSLTETLPRSKNPRTSFGTRWAQKFTDIRYADDDNEVSVELEEPWKYGATEKPRLSLQPQESFEDSEPLPWETNRKRLREDDQVEDSYDDDEEEEEARYAEEIPRNAKLIYRHSGESYEPQIDPRLYGDQNINLEDLAQIKKIYKVEFEAVDPQNYPGDLSGDENKEIEGVEVVGMEVEEFEDDENLSNKLEDDLSARSDREQQSSSGSSCDRRRRGIIDEIDTEEFILRADEISQDDMKVRKYLINEIKGLIEPQIDNSINDDRIIFVSNEPPKRPARRKKRKDIQDSYEEFFPIDSKRILTQNQTNNYESKIDDYDDKDSTSESRHKIVYHTDSATYLNDEQVEPLDDIVIVKPIRRKSKTSLRSSSLVPSEINGDFPVVNRQLPPTAPRRKRRNAQESKENIPETIRASSYEYYTFESREKLPRPQSEPPMKTTRASSQEKTSEYDKNEEYYIEPAPIPPKRHSRSRTASIIQDDDRTSRGAESIVDNEILPEDELKMGIPGYAIIEKREKAPRPPRRRKSERFATMDRPSPPKRPVRAYSIPRRGSRVSARDEFVTQPEHESTPYVEIDSEDEINDEHRNLLSGEVLDKMARRPLPPPPRPPRIKKDKYSHKDMNGFEDAREELSQNEMFASTQTDPLPDDMVIEEEVTQARLIVASSTSGSQILVSTERIPSPQHFRMTTQAISHVRIPSPEDVPYLGSSTRSEPDIRGSRITPEKEMEMPHIPPLPLSRIPYHLEEEPEMYLRSRDKSPISSRPDDDLIERPASRLINADELEERLSTFLASETFKIGNLEVGDLKVEKITVSSLDAHKISASNIDTDVITAKEISNFDLEEKLSTVHPTLLQELSSIKNQLELVSLQSQSNQEKECKTFQLHSELMKHHDIKDDKIISEDVHTFQQSLNQSDYLKLDTFIPETETRAIYSTQGSINPRERYETLSESELSNKKSKKEVEEYSCKIKYEKERSKSRSRSNSPTTKSITVRQTASPIRSLPPAISVTPDTPDTQDNQKQKEIKDIKPQRAVISYTTDEIESSQPLNETVSSPVVLNQQQTSFLALQTSQIPAQFFTLAVPQTSLPITDEPGVIDMTQQLIRALRLLGKRAMRHFVNYVVSKVSQDDSEAKIREIELAICALLLIIVGLIIVCFGGPKTITHHHHWDYFNPPRV